MPKVTSKDSSSDNSTTKIRGPNVRWTDEDDKVIVQTLLDNQGYQSDSGWKSSVWPIVVDALNAKGLNNGPSFKTAGKVADRYGSLKQSYTEVKALREMSGFGWDDVEKRVIATEEVWQNLLNVKKLGKYKKWKTKSFPLYDEMAELVDGVIANGEFAFQGGDNAIPQSDSQTSEGHNDADIEDENGGTSQESESLLAHYTKITASTQRSSATPTRSCSISCSSLKKSHGHSSRTTGSQAMVEMTNALHDIADGINDTPRRQQTAVQLLQDDGDMSEEETIEAMCFLTDNTNVVNTFIGIKDKERRTKFIRRMMERAQKN
ncbi:hypothetical protein EV360DRAFT_86732 [Lentinula raphanica]|nr:hypothetical protein EV360DRAFT_86732 [Lentinula raphanica]